MNATKTNPAETHVLSDEEESAVVVLRQLDQDRGHLLSDPEYAELRAAILHEVAAGAQLRPFTLFTFAVVIAGILTFMALGLHLVFQGTAEGWILALASLGVLCMILYFGWTFREGLRRDRLRTIDARLAELDELLGQGLVSDDEFAQIRAAILSSRQHAAQA